MNPTKNRDSERLVKHERRNSLAALLRAIKFRKRDNNQRTVVKQHFAQPRRKVRSQASLLEDSYWVRSAN